MINKKNVIIYLIIIPAIAFTVMLLINNKSEQVELKNDEGNIIEINLGDSKVAGDVDGNGNVGALDYILVRKHLLGSSKLTGTKLSRADVNGDNRVNAADYIEIRKIIIYGPSITSPTSTPRATATPSPTMTPTPTATPKPTEEPINKVNRIHFISGEASAVSTNEYGVNDSILLESYGKHAMIDTNTSSNYKNYVKPYLKQLNIKELEFVVITHLHSDHYGGLYEYLNEVTNDFKIKKVYFKADCTMKSLLPEVKTYKHNCVDSWISEEIDLLKTKLAKKNIEYINPEASGNQYYNISLGKMNLTLTNLTTVNVTRKWENENMSSIVTLVEIPKSDGGSYRTLLLADSFLDDVNANAGKKLTQNGKYKIDVLKVGHHAMEVIDSNHASSTVASNIIVTGTCKAALCDLTHCNALNKYAEVSKDSKIYFVNNVTDNQIKGDKYSTLNYKRAALLVDFNNTISINNVEMGSNKYVSVDYLSASKVINHKYSENNQIKVRDLCDSSYGWKKENGKWYFYENGAKAKGWQQIEYKGSPKWFYLDDSTGVMLTGWQDLYWNGVKSRYHFDNNGVCDSSNC